MKKIISIYIFLTFIYINLFSFKFILIEPDDPIISSFHVMTTAVTQELFEEVMFYNNSTHRGNTHPVTNVSWYEAIVFCNKLSEIHKLQPVYKYKEDSDVKTWGGIPNHRISTWTNIQADPNADGYRLLTYKEWELIYKKITSDENFIIEDYAFIYSNSGNTTHPVAQKRTDLLGLSDFLGNVKEWCYEDRGMITADHYNTQNPEKMEIYNHLSFKKFKRNDYITLKDKYGLYKVTKNSQIGIRIAKK